MAININFNDIAVVVAIYDKDMENLVIPFFRFPRLTRDRRSGVFDKSI